MIRAACCASHLPDPGMPSALSKGYPGQQVRRGAGEGAGEERLEGVRTPLRTAQLRGARTGAQGGGHHHQPFPQADLTPRTPFAPDRGTRPKGPFARIVPSSMDARG